MDDFEEVCSSIGGKIEKLFGHDVRVCVYKDMVISEDGDMYPFKEIANG